MNVKEDLLRIQESNYDAETGDKLEPEAKPAERIYLGEAEVSGTITGPTGRTMQVSMAQQGVVQDFAEEMRSYCVNCKFFDMASWRKVKAHLEASVEGQKKLNSLRQVLLMSGNAQLRDRFQAEDGDIDLEAALAFLGFCRIYTEIRRDEVVVSPISYCDPADCSPDQPNGFFQPKDNDADRIGNGLYDHIMRRAQGIKL